ncbi:MAG: hypothetical protein ACJLUP_06340 [Agrobacterium tumefaciens]
MVTDTKRHRKPAIVLTKTDYERLLRLAEAHALRNPEVSEELMDCAKHELLRAAKASHSLFLSGRSQACDDASCQ